MKRPLIISALLAIAFIASALSFPKGENLTQAQTGTLLQMKSTEKFGWSTASDGSTAADIFIGRSGTKQLTIGASSAGTNPAVTVDQATASAITGLQFTSKASGSGIQLLATGGTNENITLTPKGTGQVIIPINAAGTPSIGIADDATTGIYGQGSGFIGISSAGTGTFTCGSSGLQSRSSGQYAWTSGVISNATDAGLQRIAASVVGPTGGFGSSTGWLQNTAGRARLTANATNATATMANLTDLTIPQGGGNLATTRKVTGVYYLIAKNSTAVEGLRIDFNGGSATWSSVEFGFTATPPGAGLALGTLTSTAIGTPITATTATTADAIYTVYFSGVVNGAGTLIPRFAEVSHTAGTATVVLGSSAWVDDMPQ